MVVLIMEKVSASLRGELSRWMMEPRPGVFVGQVSAMVRDRLWQMAVQGTGRRATAKAGVGGAILLFSSPTEQGFQVRIFGETTRDLRDWEGLTLAYVLTVVATTKPESKGRRRAEEGMANIHDVPEDDIGSGIVTNAAPPASDLLTLAGTEASAVETAGGGDTIAAESRAEPSSDQHAS